LISLFGEKDGHSTRRTGVEEALREAGLLWILVDPNEAVIPGCWTEKAMKLGFKNLATAPKSAKGSKKDKKGLIN